MTHNILEKLFGSASRVKIMKLFLFNDEVVFDKDEVVKRAKVTATEAQKELKLLNEIKLLKRRNITKTTTTKTGRVSKKKVTGYVLNTNFGFLKHLRNLLINNEPLQHPDIIKRMNRVGKIKMIVISGVFIQSDDSRLDLFVVGDQIKERSFKNVVQTMESEIGKELRYTFLTTEDFKYRHGICDRLIRDLFDYQHEVVLDRIGLNG